MKWILRFILVLLLIAAAAFGAGYLIPAHHSLTRSIILKESPDQVFALLADLPNMPSWNHGVKKIEMLPLIDGKEASRQTLDGNTVMTVITTESSAPTHLVRTIGDQNGPFTGSWTYDISSAGASSQVKLTEDATVPNPLLRLLIKISGPAKYLDAHLMDLANHFGENVTPQ